MPSPRCVEGNGEALEQFDRMFLVITPFVTAVASFYFGAQTAKNRKG